MEKSTKIIQRRYYRSPKTLQKAITVLERILKTMETQEIQNRYQLQIAGYALKDLQPETLYQFFSNLIKSTPDDRNLCQPSGKESHIITNFTNGIKVSLKKITSGRCDEYTIDYYKKAVDFLYNLQPQWHRTSGHNSIRIYRSKFVFLFEIISAFSSYFLYDSGYFYPYNQYIIEFYINCIDIRGKRYISTEKSQAKISELLELYKETSKYFDINGKTQQ